MNNHYSIAEECINCRFNKICLVFKQKKEANGLNEDVEFKCEDYESE